MQEALARHGSPGIFDADQGSQLTSRTHQRRLHRGYRGRLRAIRTDGQGAWRDTVFVERLWRSVKPEEVHLRAYETVSEARASIGRHFGFYECMRPHSSLGGQTPDQAYFNQPTPISAAA